MDYKGLLKRYIGHLIWSNGDADIVTVPFESIHGRPLFTPEEMRELETLEKQVMKEYPEIVK